MFSFALNFFNELSLFSIFIFGILLFMSFLSWAIILYKYISLNKHSFFNRQFISQYEKKKLFSEIQQLAQNKKESLTAVIFRSIYQEFNLFNSKASPKQNFLPDDVRLLSESLERTMERSITQNTKNLEKYLSLLATISSSAPFIGLLGTVIGITFSFRSIAETGATSISVVAPGISEALIATAMGIFVAIPALMAYNLFRNSIRSINTDQRIFGLQLINRLVRIFRWNQ